MTIKQLLENYTIHLMSDEPCYEWYKLSFEVTAKTPEEATAILNDLRRDAGLPEWETSGAGLVPAHI